MTSSRSPFVPPRRLLGAESGKMRRLHPAEITLTVLAGAVLMFQPWALGGMYLWTQQIVGVLALLAFIVALVPRHLTELHHAGGEVRLIMWPKLLRFPFFWLGLVYVGFVLIQIFNPAWQWQVNERGAWWLLGIDHIKWLPHGMADTPARMMNGWRAPLIHGSIWLLVCALWVGVTRRKTARMLVYLIVLNGVVLAFAVLLQRLTGAKKLLWFWDAPAHYFAASFIYKNHAGAFFLLILAGCLGLAWWHAAHAERRLQKSHPGMVFVLAAAVVTFALILTYARAATALGAVLLLLTGLTYGLRAMFRRSGGPPRVVTAITALLAAGFVVLGATTINTETAWKRFERLFKEDEFSSITSRKLAARATLDMARDSLAFGHGVGGYRYLFPLYQQHYPEIWQQQVWHAKKQEFVPGRRLFWEHAHNDYAQLLAEAGLFGAGLALTALLLILAAIRKFFAWTQPPLLVFLAGPGVVAISAYADFPAHNPAIFTTAAAITTLALRWAACSRH